MKNWLTRTADLRLAQRLVEEYLDLHDGRDLVLYEYISGDELRVISDQPGWMEQLRYIYWDRYGAQLSQDITNKVVSFWITQGATVH